MKLPRLLHTSAVRLALQYTALYALALGVAAVALFWSSSRYVDGQLRADIEQESMLLVQKFHDGGVERLVEAINGRVEDALDEGRYYLLVTKEGRSLAGNLTTWPDEASVSFNGEVHNLGRRGISAGKAL